MIVTQLETFSNRKFRSVAAFLVAAFMCASDAHADLLFGSVQTTFASGGTPVDLEVLIDTDLEKVTVEMVGRSDGWFAVGFGNSIMQNTYGILAHQNGLVEERKLNYAGGSVLSPELTVVSNSVSGGLRTLTVERDLSIADTDYYSFPDTESTIALIVASQTGDYGYHGSDNRASNAITLTAVPEPSGFAFAGLVVVFGTFRRRK